MPTRAQEPPPNHMIRELQTPDPSLGFFTELVARDSQRFLDLSPIRRGTPYTAVKGADPKVIDHFPTGLWFLKETVPIGSNTVAGMRQSDWVQWIWGTDPDAEGVNNATVDYLGDAIANPAYVRTFTVRRDLYDASPTTALGTAYTALIAIKVTAGGTGYSKDDPVNIAGSLGAEAALVVDENGAITHVVIKAGGSGYDSASLPAVTITSATGSGATLTAVVQPKTAILTSQKKVELPDNDPRSHHYVGVVKTFETLPGPNLPYTRFDNDLGNVQGYRQAVVYANQAAAVTATGKTTYEAREGSSYVAWKVVETWSDGSGGEGNPIYPIQTSTDFEKDGILKVTTKQLKPVASIVTSEDLTAGVLTRKYKLAYPDNPALAFQIIETITVDDGNLLDLPSFTTRIPNLIPEIFRAQIPTHVESHIVEGEAEETVLLTGEFEHSERQLTPLYKEVRSEMLDAVSLPVTITGIKETNEKKQVVSVTMTLEADSTTPTVPTATRDVDFKKLGNGLAIEIVRTVPDVFPEDSYTKSILNLIPEKFRALIPITESTVDSAGSPSTNPTLLTGELSRTEGRLTQFTKRVRVTSLGDISLPVSVTDTETNDQKQTVAVIHTLQTSGTSTAVPTALIDVNVVDLGNGYEVETLRTIAGIFDPAAYTTSIPNLIPEIFRAAIPTHTEIHFVEGIASQPSLGTGEFSRSERQINEFVKEERVEVLDDIGSLPITISGQKETNDRKQVVTVAMTLEADTTTPTVPTALIDVDFKKLGNGLSVEITKTIPSVFDAALFEKRRDDTVPERFKASVPAITTKHTLSGTASAPSLATGDLYRSERQLDAFTYELTITNRDISSLPTLEGQKYDEDLDVLIPYEEQVLAAGTALGNPSTEVQPLGGGLDLVTIYDLSAIATAFADFEIVMPDSANLDLPDVLEDLELIDETHAGRGHSEHTGTGYWSVSGSTSRPETAEAQLSQQVETRLLPTIAPTYGNGKDTTRCVFLLPMPVTKADVLSKLSAMLGVSVVAWPAFHPRPIHAVLTGRQISLRANASVNIQDGGNIDSGAQEHNESSGTGYSVETGISVTTVEIRPTIHGAVLGGPTGGDGGGWEYVPDTIEVIARADQTWGAGTVVADIKLTTDSSASADNADQIVEIVDLPQTSVELRGVGATDGDTSIPISGVRLLPGFRGEPYKYNHAMFHAEVFDFADL